MPPFYGIAACLLEFAADLHGLPIPVRVLGPFAPMIPAPMSVDESKRLAALRNFQILDTLPESAYDDITILASQICGVPIALISLVDADRQWFKSRIGLEAAHTARDIAFCAHAILEPDKVFIVSDTLKDKRFCDNPLVIADPSIRFYAGAPILTDDGHALGTVCAIDRKPRRLSASQIESLRSLARLVSALLERGRLARLESERLNEAHRRETEFQLALGMQGLDLQALVDFDYIHRHVNQTYLDYWGAPRESIEGHAVENLLGEAVFRDRIKPCLDRALAGEAVDCDTKIDYPTKGSRDMEIAFLPVYGNDGKILGAVVRFHDVTALVERQEQLAETVKKLETKTLVQQRFIHILSHDLREPVNTIVNFASLLAEKHSARLDEMGRNFTTRVLNGGRRMKALLDDLLELVRLDDKQLTHQPVNLNALLDEVRLDLADAIERTGARVDATRLPVIFGERHLLRVLLQNLVANAIKFVPKGIAPQVVIRSVESVDTCEILIEDNGIGIPQNQFDKVFDLFRRLHAHGNYEGTGLGLAICRKIAEIHHGRIWVTSEEACGSCFHVAFPVGLQISESRQSP